MFPLSRDPRHLENWVETCRFFFVSTDEQYSEVCFWRVFFRILSSPSFSHSVLLQRRYNRDCEAMPFDTVSEPVHDQGSFIELHVLKIKGSKVARTSSRLSLPNDTVAAIQY